MTFSSRHIDPGYIKHTLQLKAKAKLSKIKYQSKPFVEFENLASNQSIDYDLEYADNYHSFSYFKNSKHAQSYYKSSSALISEVIKLLVHYNEYGADSKLLIDLDKILRQAELRNGSLVHPEQESYGKFDMKNGAVSGILHGKLMSLTIRAYKDTKDQKYLSAATGYRNTLLLPATDQGPYRVLKNGAIWIEEYPSDSPSMVLNGHLFALIALAEYAVITEDQESVDLFEKCLASAIGYLPYYWQGDDLLYSMYHWDLCNVHYLGIMTYQFEHLYQLTGVEDFQKAATKLKARCPWSLFEKLIDGRLL